MEKNVHTIQDVDVRLLCTEANANGPAATTELTVQEEPKFFVRSDAASHSQHDR